MRIDHSALQQMYPGMSREFESRMQSMIRSLPTAKEVSAMKHRSFRSAAIILIIAAIMTTSAFALSRPAVLDWLLGAGPASELLTDTVQTVFGETAADGITARVTSAVFDGSTLVFAYELENANPAQAALVAIDPYIRIENEDVWLLHTSASPHSPTLVPSPHLDVLPVQRNPVRGGGETSQVPASLTGKLDCELTLRIYRPRKAFAYMISPDSMLAAPEALDPASRAEAEDALNTLGSISNLVIVPPGKADPAQWTAAGYSLLGDVDGAASAHLTETACMTLRFSIDASQAVFHDFSGLPDVHREDCTVQVDQLRLSPLETSGHLLLLPAENSEEAAHALKQTHGNVYLTDGEGRPVEYSSMDYLSDLPRVKLRDGQWVYELSWDMPGLLHFPDCIRIMTDDGELLRLDLSAE